MANNLAAFDPLKFSSKVVEHLDPLTLALRFAEREYEGDLTENSTVRIRSVGNITMGTYTKGVTTISYQDLAPTFEDFTVTDSQFFAFQVEDIDKRQNDLDAESLYAQRAATEIANTVERKIWSQYTKALAANKVTGDAGASITITKDNVYETFVGAAEKLNDQNAPGADRWMVVDPKTASAIALSPSLIRSTAMGDAIVQGNMGVAADQFIGVIAGFRTYWSNFTPKTTGAGASKFLVYGAGKPVNYAGQIAEVELIRLQDRFATAMRGLLLHDATVLAEHSKRLGTIKVAP
jgi:hypothetical protein